MPARDNPTEFGGKTGSHGIQPARRPRIGKTGFTEDPGHVTLTSSEQLHLLYATGQIEDQSVPTIPEVMEGLLPEIEQRKLREDVGDLDKGVVF